MMFAFVTPIHTAAICSYVQPVVMKHICSGTKDWLAEMRKVSVLFVNLIEPYKESKLKKLQDVLFTMQNIIFKYDGLVRQFMIDDKGCVFIGKRVSGGVLFVVVLVVLMVMLLLLFSIAGFGLAGCTHEDDALRSVMSALEIKEALSGPHFWPCSIGITRGKGV
jgi:hypothetical protein